MSPNNFLRSNWHVTNIIFIRHGESYNNCIYDVARQNLEDKKLADPNFTYTSQDLEAEIDKMHDPDCGLSPRGLKQAEALGDYLSTHLSDLTMISDLCRWKVYSSPMKRCLLTANQVSRGLGNKEVIVHPNFFESDGCYLPQHDGTTIGLPGMKKLDVEGLFSQFKCLEGMEDGWYKANHKETRREFYDRSKTVVDYLWQEHFRIHSQGECNSSKLVDEKQPSDSLSDAKTTKDSTESADFPTSSQTEGLILVVHGNLIASTVSFLLGSNALIPHSNTGFTHLQLWSDKNFETKLVSLMFTNRVSHLSHHPELIAGEKIFEDHWIQEFLAPLD